MLIAARRHLTINPVKFNIRRTPNMRLHYTIPAFLLALSCAPRESAECYADVGRLNLPDDSWEPAAIAVAPGGTVYVGDSSLNCAVQIFDADGVYLGAIGGLGKGPGELFVPTDVAVGPAGKIYVSEFGTHRVSIFRADGTFVKAIGERDLVAPLGVAVGADGKMYVADVEAGGLLVFSPEGALLETWGEDRDTGQIMDVAVAPDGGVAYAPGAAGEVLFFTPGRADPLRLRTGEDAASVPAEVAFGPRGEFFILSQRTDVGGTLENSVAKFSPKGELLEEVPLSLTSPSAVAVAPDGTMYVADGPRHEVRIYRPGQNDKLK
jgi:DNA-binding beta-propeller fold protein YncE